MDENSADPMTPDLNHIFMTFMLQALIAMGKIPQPSTQEIHVDLKMAKYFTGVLEILKEKTKGNLTEDEQNKVDEMLHKVRMAFVEATHAAKS